MYEKELFKTANTTATFIVVSNFGNSVEKEDGGRPTEFNKLVYIIIQRDENNKALKTLKFWQDTKDALYMMHLINQGVLTSLVDKDGMKVPKMKVNEFKRTKKGDRAFSVEAKKTDQGTKLRFGISLKNSDGDKDGLYFDLDILMAKKMAYEIHMFIECYMQAKINQELMEETLKGFFTKKTDS